MATLPPRHTSISLVSTSLGETESRKICGIKKSKVVPNLNCVDRRAVHSLLFFLKCTTRRAPGAVPGGVGFAQLADVKRQWCRWSCCRAIPTVRWSVYNVLQ